MQKEFVDAIHEQAVAVAEEKGIKEPNKAQTKLVIDATFHVLRKLLLKIGEVRVSQFGTFTRKTRPPHPGMNFQTGDPMEVGERDVILFDPTDDFKRSLNVKHKLK